MIHIMPKLLGLAQELRRLATRGGAGPDAVRLVPRRGCWSLVEVRKKSRTLTAWVDASDDRFFDRYQSRLPCMLHVIARAEPSVATVWCNLDDRGSDEEPPKVGYCSNGKSTILIPDSDFYNLNGYQYIRDLLGTQRPWGERSDQVLWRGATSGRGRVPAENDSLLEADVLPRIRMCALLQSRADVDAKIYRAVQDAGPEHENRFRREGLFDGDHIHESRWLEHRYALDIDGNGNAWTNLFVRLLLGCCVIKVESPAGLRQWYYDRLVPWKHYVPVRPDMSDLIEKIDWRLQHSEECSRIAAAGQALARSMTLDGELQAAAVMIGSRLRDVA